MASKGQTLIGWMAATSGIVLIYSAYKNVSPLSVVTGQLTGNPTRATLDPNAGFRAMSDDVSGSSSFAGSGSSGGGNYKASATASQRITNIANRVSEPTLVPIPWQPNATLDAEALFSLGKVQAQYGKPLFVTSGYRSYSSQAAGYASDPTRFAPPDSSLHTVGLAIDFNTNSVNVEDPKLVALMSDAGWYRVGKSGHMHWSYGVPG